MPVTEAVAEAETLVAPQLRAKGLGYTWSGAPPGLRVRADREKLQQVLLNLLGNAVKFTDERDGTPGRIEVACAVDGGRVRIHVRDTGGDRPGRGPHRRERNRRRLHVHAYPARGAVSVRRTGTRVS